MNYGKGVQLYSGLYSLLPIQFEILKIAFGYLSLSNM